MHFYCIFPRKNGKLTHKLIFKWWQKFNHRLLTTIDCLGIQPGLQLKRLNNVVTLPPFMCSLFIEISGFPWHKFQLLCSSILKPLRTYDLPTARVSRQKQWYQCIRSKIFFFGGGGGGLSFNSCLFQKYNTQRSVWEKWSNFLFGGCKSIP